MSRTPLYEGFRRTSNLLKPSNGWCQHHFVLKKTGGRCLVQALADSFGVTTELNTEIVAPLHTELMKQRDYRRLAASEPELPARALFIRWNDANGRQKHEVLQALDNVANRLEAEYLRGEVQRLQDEIEQLQNQNQRLRDRIKELVRPRQSAVLARLEADLGATAVRLAQVVAG